MIRASVILSGADPGEVADSAATPAEPIADLSGSKGENVFFILGLLDDYAGRSIIEDIDRVESFYCNEHVVAYVFKAYMARVAEEQGLHAQLREQWRQECLVQFFSPEASAFINQFYTYWFSDDGRAMTDQGPKRIARADLPPSQILERGTSLKLAFLAGAYYRYGRSGSFNFANSIGKAKLIIDLLNDVGCDSVRIASRPGLPANNRVYFVPTSEVLDAFARLPGAWALTAADSAVGAASADEIAIYREIIRIAQRGDFDGCVLPPSFDVARFTSIPMAKREHIPESVPARVEALSDYDRVAATLRSVQRLATDSIRVLAANQMPDRAMAGTGRVGFSRDGHTAVTIFYYRAGPHPQDCMRVIAVFLSREGDGWVPTAYSSLR